MKTIDIMIVCEAIKEQTRQLIEAQQKHYGFYQLCPKCDGQKKVSYPPYFPGGLENFSSSQAEWPCDICRGEGILVRPEIKPGD